MPTNTDFQPKCTKLKMIKLQYFNGSEWIDCGKFYNETSAWDSLGFDNEGYRTIDDEGNVLTDKS